MVAFFFVKSLFIAYLDIEKRGAYGKMKIAVLFGGQSSEYEVSLASSYSVLLEIDKEKYDVIKIGITKNGKWYLYEGDISLILNDTWHKSEAKKELIIDINRGAFMSEGKPLKIDKILPVLHGEYGEDGRYASIFDTLNVDFVGPNFFSGAITMDKDVSKLVAKREGIPVSNWTVLFKEDLKNMKKTYRQVEKIGYPVFVKPSRAGSSVGVSRVDLSKDLPNALQRAFSVSDKVLVEEKIDGQESEISLISINGRLITSTVGQIEYDSEFYDYKTKYHSANVKYIIPAKMTKKSEALIKKYAKRLFSSLEIKGFCRMDFFIKENGEVIFNEVNALPGFTGISMFPKLLMHDGYTFKDIINYILNI